MDEFSGVFFKVGAGYTDSFAFYVNVTVYANRLIVL